MDPADRWKHIAPASNEPGQQRSTPDSKRRRHAVAVACVQCRSGKSKCDGVRPRCTRCSENDLSCQYDVAEGVSRAERMKLLKRDSMSSRVDEMERIMHALRSETDLEARKLLARLRLGERVEDLAKLLPPMSLPFPLNTSITPSLSTQESAGTTASSGSADSIATYSEQMRPLFGLETFPSTAHRPSGLATHMIHPPDSSPLDKGKQAIGATTTPALHILFDREDFLRTHEEIEEDSRLSEQDTTVDPRLLTQIMSFDSASEGFGSPMDTTRSIVPSPQKEQMEGHLRITHLKNRQPTVDTIRIHPNLNLRTHMSNMPFVGTDWMGNYVSSVHDIIATDLVIPAWAMMTVNTRPDLGRIRDAIQGILLDATMMMDNGTPVELIIERHPNIAALYQEEEYQRCGILSRWAVGMVHSTLLRGNDFTAFASMYIYWYLMRWMISPSKETYDTVPEWLRPTPNQLFMPHTSILDFIIWPAFREYAVQFPEFQEQMEWMLDMSKTIKCDWHFSVDEAFKTDEETGLVDLCDSAKTSLRDLTSWSVGPSFRLFVTNADSYLQIRTENY